MIQVRPCCCCGTVVDDDDVDVIVLLEGAAEGGGDKDVVEAGTCRICWKPGSPDADWGDAGDNVADLNCGGVDMDENLVNISKRPLKQ